MALMRSVSGIRGVVGATLTPDVLLRHTRAFLDVIQAKRIVLGRDTRPTGPVIVDLVQAACRMAGVEVVDLGIATTPTVELMVEELQASGGIIITASHNPIEWNALKFLDAKGMFLGPQQAQELFALADANQFSWSPWSAVATLAQGASGDAVHIQKVLEHACVDVPAIRQAKFKVVLDAVNGAGSLVLPQLLEALGCEVVRLHCTPNGIFPRGAEPTPESLEILGRTVRESHAHVGFALDPDADRCALVDSLGRSVGEEYTLAIACDTVLDRLAGPICINLSTSQMNADVAERHGQLCYRAPVGEINVSLAMIEKGCVMGGEGNGGTILPSLHYGRDSLVACALVLDYMARKDKKVEDWVAENPAYAMPKIKVALGNKSVAQVVSEVKQKFAGWTADERDGLWLGQGKAWVHVRASNTEPVLRIIAEAPTELEANQLCDIVKACL